MLRWKLMSRIGLLVLGFVAGAVVAIVLLQGVLRDLDTMSADAARLMDSAADLTEAMGQVELYAAEARAGRPVDGPALVAQATRLEQAVRRLGLHGLMRADAAGADQYARLDALITPYVARACALAAPAPSPIVAREIQEASPALRQEAVALGRIARTHVAEEHRAVSTDLRMLVIGLTIAALVMVNVAVFILLRTGQIILRPVDALVRGSRELAREQFDHRVNLPQNDEFGELAYAYNRLAEQLQSNEARKIEVLQQLAVTLNHELNNVIGVIELQLGLMDRRAGGDPAQVIHLRRIRDSLARITGTVAALKDVRRIVLTDYGPGQKMIDLALSSGRSADAPPTKSVAGSLGVALGMPT